MATVDAAIIKNVHRYLDTLRKSGLVVSRAYIFGSYARGNADAWSDIDVAIVSPQISNDRLEERVRLTKLAVSIDDRIEPLPFNPSAFNEDDPFVRHIMEEGMSVH